jgi:hypothetical protein
MHASKDSIGREIYYSFAKFSGSKLGLILTRDDVCIQFLNSTNIYGVVNKCTSGFVHYHTLAVYYQRVPAKMCGQIADRSPAHPQWSSKHEAFSRDLWSVVAGICLLGRWWHLSTVFLAFLSDAHPNKTSLRWIGDCLKYALLLVTGGTAQWSMISSLLCIYGSLYIYWPDQRHLLWYLFMYSQ